MNFKLLKSFICFETIPCDDAGAARCHYAYLCSFVDSTPEEDDDDYSKQNNRQRIPTTNKPMSCLIRLTRVTYVRRP